MTEEQQIIQYFLSILGQIKLLHWSTKLLSVHKALDDLHHTLSEKIDKIVECYIGRFKKTPLPVFTIKMTASSDTNKIDKYLEQERQEILKLAKRWEKYPELKNVLEDMALEINQALYLCALM